MPFIPRIQPWWTPRYAFDKLVVRQWERTNPTEPWLTSASVELLKTLLTPRDVGLEWGSGRSTIWFARRVAKLTSVETIESWYRQVLQQLKDAKLENVDYLWCRELPDAALALEEYVGVVESFSDESLDFALVDGAFRSACANRVIPKLRRGGLLIVDDVHRFVPSNSRSPKARTASDGPRNGIWWEGTEGFRWSDFLEGVQGWPHLWTSNGVKDTAIWIKR